MSTRHENLTIKLFSSTISKQFSDCGTEFVRATVNVNLTIGGLTDQQLLQAQYTNGILLAEMTCSRTQP
ncbi:MAG TPA: hypothetical protein VIV60_14675, partial [Polyangiaceae bacterium]